MWGKSQPLTSPQRRSSAAVLRAKRSEAALVIGIPSRPAKNRSWLRWSRKQRTRVLALVPRGSQLTTSKRPPPNASNPSGSPPNTTDTGVAGPARVHEHRADPLLGLAGEVADQREADRAPVRAIPVERHADPGALQVLAGGIAYAPGDRGADAVRPRGAVRRAGGARVAGRERDQTGTGQRCGGEEHFPHGARDGPSDR